MDHFRPFIPRKILLLPTIEVGGWQLKRYGILAKDTAYEEKIIASALSSAIERLPKAGSLGNPNSNHGVGFQIVHFAEVAVVSPVFYWLWGSVLANAEQMRAQWDNPNKFKTGVTEVVGCVWEMQVVSFESQAWAETMLGEVGTTNEKLTQYLETSLPAANQPSARPSTVKLNS